MKKNRLFFVGLFLLFGCFLFWPSNHENVAHAADYSPYSAKMSNVSGAIQGSRGSSFTSGKKLVYDVYDDDGWKIASHDYGKGSQKYLEFKGWSAIVGYHNHHDDNQENYIVLTNSDTGKQKIYLLQQTTGSASKDLEFNRQSDTDPINHPCSDDDYNQTNDFTEGGCNMYYSDVTWTAHIPLSDLFPTGQESSKWAMRIYKKVENKVVYDKLRIPFEFSGIDYGDGKITLDSGLNAQNLIMNSDGVIQRTEPRGTGASNGDYFDKDHSYVEKKINQDYTVVWYGVKSPEDGGATRWAASPYWTFGGDQAVLSYQIDKKTCPDGSTVNVDQACSVNVTITHKDFGTNTVLRTDHEKATVGNSYSFSPESKGVFKDSDGNPYEASPTGQAVSGTTPNNNMSFTFTYKAVEADPSTVKQADGTTDGQASGQFSWQLKKPDESKDSIVDLENTFQIAGAHYATKNVQNEVSSDGIFDESDSQPMDFTIDPTAVKGKKINYSFGYDYTNFYHENYTCTDKQGNDCFKWEFKDNTPAWESPYGQHAAWTATLSADHHEGETFDLDLKNNQKTLLVGQVAKPNGAAIKTTNENESFTIPVPNQTNLATQTWLDIMNGPVNYHVDISGEKWHAEQGTMDFYPIDLDPSLRDKYKNKTPFAYTDYAIPLKIVSTDKTDDQSWNITIASSEAFFLTHHTGFEFSVPRGSSNATIESAAKSGYESYTGTSYDPDDNVLREGDDDSRYYLPVDAQSPLKPQKIYENEIVLGKLGLSDVTFRYGQDFSFQRYLIGNVFDDPQVNEQHAPVKPMSTDSYEDDIFVPIDKRIELAKLSLGRSNMLFGFRTSDNLKLRQQMEKIIDLPNEIK